MERQADPDPDLSIPAFFAGKTVLLTGATGFLAKAIVEKILRDLPEVGKVILLVRGKGGADPSDEVAWRRAWSEIFGSGLFARLRRERGCDFDRFVREKIECLGGDVRITDLGLGAERFARLGEEVDLVINCAASVSFDERLDTALDTNVRGVANLLDFARAAGAVFVQVSTAYVCGQRTGEIEEAVLPPCFDFDAEIAGLREVVEDSKSAFPSSETFAGEMVRYGMEQANARGWIDTYTYTKYLGEQWLARGRGEVPAVIVRPSIIESCLEDPEPGWIEGLRMADPIMIAAGRGLTRFPMDLDTVLDLIPLDFVVNAILAASCHAGNHPARLEVFTVATGSENPLFQREIIGYVRSYYERLATATGAGLPKWSYPPAKRFKRILAWQIRLLSLSGIVLGKFSRFKQARRYGRDLRRRQFGAMKIQVFLERYGPYLRLRSCFETVNSRRLLESLPLRDRQRFGFDVTLINWRSYIHDVHLPGLFRNVVAESRKSDGEECIGLELENSPRLPGPSDDRSALDLSRLPMSEI